MWCGDCHTCLAHVSRVLATPPRHGKTRSRMTPTPEALERHAKKYGPEGVVETAAELGVDVKVERKTERRRRGGPTLKQRVAAHIEAGHSVDVIAELENLTPGRARRIIEELP